MNWIIKFRNSDGEIMFDSGYRSFSQAISASLKLEADGNEILQITKI